MILPEKVGIKTLGNHAENTLVHVCEKLLGLKIYGEKQKSGCRNDLDKLESGRTGHHCTQPIMDFFNVAGTRRASFAVF